MVEHTVEVRQNYEAYVLYHVWDCVEVEGGGSKAKQSEIESIKRDSRRVPHVYTYRRGTYLHIVQTLMRNEKEAIFV